MKDLSIAINEAVEEMSNNGTVQKIINESAENMIKNAIQSAFAYNSPLKNKVDEAVKASIQIDLNQVDFSKHNTAMIHAISESFKNEMLVTQTEEMKQKIASIFKAPEKTNYTITEFVDALCEQIKNSSVSDYDEDTEVKVSVKSGICGYDFKLSVGEDSYRRGDSDHVRIVIRENDKRREKEAGKIFIIHSPSVNLGTCGGLENWLYGLYSHGVTIVDCESFDVNKCDLTVWDDEENEDY